MDRALRGAENPANQHFPAETQQLQSCRPPISVPRGVDVPPVTLRGVRSPPATASSSRPLTRWRPCVAANAGLFRSDPGHGSVCRHTRSEHHRDAGFGAAARERNRTMEYVIAAAVLALGLVSAAFLIRRRPAVAGAQERSSATAAVPERPAPRGDEEAALARRAEMGRLEERLLGREQALDARATELDAREAALQQNLADVRQAHEGYVRALERTSGLSASQAKHILL